MFPSSALSHAGGRDTALRCRATKRRARRTRPAHDARLCSGGWCAAGGVLCAGGLTSSVGPGAIASRRRCRAAGDGHQAPRGGAGVSRR